MSHTAVPYAIWIAPLSPLGIDQWTHIRVSPLVNEQRREEYRIIQWMGAKVRAGPGSSHSHRLDRARGWEAQRHG